jgi:hypothetical protein
LTAGKEPEMGDKMIAIDTRTIPWEEGYNEKLGRMLYRYYGSVSCSSNFLSDGKI